jgi:hypothetical protein
VTIDANPLDIACMVTGMGNVILQKFRRSLHLLDDWELFPALPNGMALPPVFLLICAAWASELLLALAKGSRPTLFIAGMAAMWALLRGNQNRRARRRTDR